MTTFTATGCAAVALSGTAQNAYGGSCAHPRSEARTSIAPLFGTCVAETGVSTVLTLSARYEQRFARSDLCCLHTTPLHIVTKERKLERDL